MAAFPLTPRSASTLSTPARGFWLATSLLTAALLFAPSPATAHNLQGDVHGHFNISLTPSTITEGQTTTVSYSYSGPQATVFARAVDKPKYNIAYMKVTKSTASPSGGGAVNFSANTRWSWTSYLGTKQDAGLGSGLFQGNESGTVTITPVDDSNVTGTRTVSVSELCRPAYKTIFIALEMPFPSFRAPC